MLACDGIWYVSCAFAHVELIIEDYYNGVALLTMQGLHVKPATS